MRSLHTDHETSKNVQGNDTLRLASTAVPLIGLNPDGVGRHVWSKPIDRRQRPFRRHIRIIFLVSLPQWPGRMLGLFAPTGCGRSSQFIESGGRQWRRSFLILRQAGSSEDRRSGCRSYRAGWSSPTLPGGLTDQLGVTWRTEDGNHCHDHGRKPHRISP